MEGWWRRGMGRIWEAGGEEMASDRGDTRLWGRGQKVRIPNEIFHKQFGLHNARRFYLGHLESSGSKSCYRVTFPLTS